MTVRVGQWSEWPNVVAIENRTERRVVFVNFVCASNAWHPEHCYALGRCEAKKKRGQKEKNVERRKDGVCAGTCSVGY